MPSDRLRASRSYAPSLLGLTLLILCACSAPSERPLEAAELEATVERRSTTAEELAQALDLAGLQPLAFDLPTQEDLQDPSRSAFWHAAAWAWSPRTRSARRVAAAARARTASAGAPAPIEAMVEAEDLTDPGMFTRSTVRFDLLGLLGLGPAAAASALADAETRAAFAALEQAAWRSRFEVDAGRARLAKARVTLERLRALQAQAEEAHPRIEILARHGRLEGAALADAELALRALARRIAALEIEASRAAEGLAVDAGLPPGSPALDAPGTSTLDELASLPTGPDPTRSELLERLPDLRLALLDYAVAEARLRQEAIARWPSLQLGPHLLWRQSDFLLGALAATGIPWPGALEGRIAAASQEREAARERTEDALLAACARLDGANGRLAAARVLLERDARPSAEASGQRWTAARARFAIDPTALREWSDALRMRAEALAVLGEARGGLALAALERAEAAGPPSRSARVARAEEVLP